MNTNNKLYKQYMYIKSTLKKIISPTSVVTNIIPILAIEITPATTAQTKNERNSTTTNNTTYLHLTQKNTNEPKNSFSPLEKRTINFDQYKNINSISNIESEVDSDIKIFCRALKVKKNLIRWR